jgi:glycosyltransferase involved in cell wall biosynthesis
MRYNTNMKVALVHDYIKEYGGAEKVLEALHEIYPDATVFTSVYLPQFLGPHKTRFADWNIKTSWAQYLPLKQKLISPLRVLSPFLFRSFDFSGYDVIIVSATGAYFPNALKKKSAFQVCYCHTPPRYLYGYATAREWRKNIVVKIIGEVMSHVLRIIDYYASRNVDLYIANSEEVKKRIEKFYRREAVVVYPPVKISKKYPEQNKQKKEYFVAGGRLARPKHIDLIVKACLELNVPLKVFGKSFAGYGEELQLLVEGRQSKVELLGEVTDEEKAELLAGAKAYLFASVDEDFGILPVEAMAQGTPVIAYRSGGVRETVIDGKTGLFFDELSVEALKTAIRKLERSKFDEDVCRQQARKFADDRFKKEIEQVIHRPVK